MDILANFKTGLRIGLILLSAPLIYSCGGSSSDDSDSAEQALDSAAKNIAQVIATNADGLSGVGANSEALGGLLEPFGVTLAENGDEGLSDEFIELLETLLDDDTAIITQNGDTILVRPAPAESCNDIAESLGFAEDDPLYADCLDAMDDFLIRIVEDDSESGTLSMSYDGNVFVTMDYSPTRVTVAQDIGASVSALESLVMQLDPEAEVDTPDILEGVIELDMQALGEEHGSVSLAITQSIVVSDESEGYDIEIEPATLFSVEADGIAGEATLSSNLSSIEALFPTESDTAGEVPGRLELVGATVSISITEGGEAATGNLGFGPLTFDLDTGVTETVLSFLLDPEFTIDPESGAITLDTALDLDLAVADALHNVLLGQEGTLNVDAPAGTSFVDAGDGVFRVTAGSITFVGSDDFADMDSGGAIQVDQCFDADGRADCPE